MTHNIAGTNASFAPSSRIVLDAKIREYLEPIFGALREAQHQHGRFRFYGYLAAVYRTYKEWKDFGISKRMAHRLARQLPTPRRKSTCPVRTLIDATFPALDSKQKSRWSRALEFAAMAKVSPDDLPKLFKNSSGISGCARLATQQNPKKKRNAWIS
jgi:hypothetical protein